MTHFPELWPDHFAIPFTDLRINIDVAELEELIHCFLNTDGKILSSLTVGEEKCHLSNLCYWFIDLQDWYLYF